MVGGMLAAIKFSHTKNPRPGSMHTKYAMWDLEDLDGIMRCILWPEQFAQFGELVKSDAILAVRAAIDRRPGAEEINLIVNELIPLEELSARFSNAVMIRVREDEHGVETLTSLREIIRGYPGSKPLRLRLELAEGGSVMLDLQRRAPSRSIQSSAAAWKSCSARTVSESWAERRSRHRRPKGPTIADGQWLGTNREAGHPPT